MDEKNHVSKLEGKTKKQVVFHLNITCRKESGVVGRTEVRIVLFIENTELCEPGVTAPPISPSPPFP